MTTPYRSLSDMPIAVVDPVEEAKPISERVTQRQKHIIAVAYHNGYYNAEFWHQPDMDYLIQWNILVKSWWPWNKIYKLTEYGKRMHNDNRWKQ